MYFQAEAHGVKYEINVTENRDFWHIGLKPEEKDWVHYEFPKADYQNLDNTISFIFNQSSYLVDVVGEGTEYVVYTRGSFRTIKIYNEEKLLHESLKAGGNFGGGDNLISGMPGKVVKVFVEKGQQVKEGDPLLIMEAMKMENEMKADRDVVVKDVHATVGESVDRGALLISFET